MSEFEGDKVRTRLLHTLLRLSDRYPMLRIAQLIGNAVPEEVKQRLSNDLYYMEDSELTRYLLEFEGKIETLREEGRERGKC